LGKIKLLSEEIINQIAAGEIVERPASALKEIVENSIDASSKNICVFLGNGGKSKMVVEDDGEGLSRDDLLLSVRRHATSKMHSSNLFDICSYGFRGEALSSIASVSTFSIESNGFGVSVNSSGISEIYPSPFSNGTRITVSNIFGSTPARLKFLKSDNAELSACLSVIENFVFVKKNVNFEVRSGNQLIMAFKEGALEDRISKVFGADLFARSIYFEEMDESISIKGYLFHPLDSKYSSSMQRIFVNDRIVRDKTVSLSLKNAYMDLVPNGKFAAAIIFIEIDPFHIDVNVSPTKSEIRFRNIGYVQKALTATFRRNLSKFDKIPLYSQINLGNNALDTRVKLSSLISSEVQRTHQLSSSAKYLDDNTCSPMITHGEHSPGSSRDLSGSSSLSIPLDSSHRPSKNLSLELSQNSSNSLSQDLALVHSEQKQFDSCEAKNFFGTPICQIFDMYIIAEKDDSIVVIDQHAVHEKITQEKILNSLTKESKQYLMRPEIIELTASQQDFIMSVKSELESVGFSIDLVQSSLFISAIPSILPMDSVSFFMANILESENAELAPVDLIKSSIANVACRSSIRAGRQLHLDEMKALLNEMERTESIHQCPHNRPSFTVKPK
jgi:DNA mismatch repair protein MutL